MYKFSVDGEEYEISHYMVFVWQIKAIAQLPREAELSCVDSDRILGDTHAIDLRIATRFTSKRMVNKVEARIKEVEELLAEFIGMEINSDTKDLIVQKIRRYVDVALNSKSVNTSSHQDQAKETTNGYIAHR